LIFLYVCAIITVVIILDGNDMKIHESAEMYLETILILSREMGAVRSIDICERMGFSKPSVSRAIGLLKSGGYVTVSAEGHVTLTETGLEVAGKIYERHNILTRFLVGLGVSEEVASADACKIEHVISDETLGAIKKHL